MEKKIVRAYLLFNFLFWFPHSFVFAIYVLFLREANMSFYEIGIVNVSFMIGIVLLEIPTGVIADFFGRKISMILGMFTCSLGLLIYYFSYGLWAFVFAESVAAVGATFLSGAGEAWLKDSLDFNGYGKKVLSVFSWGEIVDRGSTILGGALGAFIGIYNLRLPWLIAAIGVFVSGVICSFVIREDYFEKKSFGWRESCSQMRKIFRDSISYGYGHKIVWLLIVGGAIGSVGSQALNMLWSVYFSDALGAEVVSAAWILLMLFAMLGLYLANCPRMKKVSHRKAMVVGCASTAICVFAATMFENGWVALLIFGLHEVGRSIFDLRRKVYVHDHVPSDKRATIVSFGSMVIHFGAAIGWLVTGFLADKIGIAACWQISAAVMLVAALFAFKLPWRGN